MRPEIIWTFWSCVEINVKIRNIKQIITHEFKVINSKTYRNILFGRDFMKLFKTVKFDLGGNKIQVTRG